MNPYSANKCKNCVHHAKNDEGELFCGIGGNCNSNEPCGAFAPANFEIAYKHASNIVDSAIYKFTLTRFIKACTIAVGFAILALIIAEWESDSVAFIWWVGAAAFLLLIVGGVLYWEYHIRRKNLEYTVEQKFNESLTEDYILKALNERNKKSELLKKDDGQSDGILFTSRGQRFLLSYSGTTIFLLHRTGGFNMDEARQSEVAERIGREILTTKVFVTRLDDGEIIVDSICNMHINTCKTFNSCFWEYFYDLERTVNKVYENMGDAQPVSPVQNNSRHEMYQPEFRWFPGLVEMVSKGITPIEALTDQEWIRTTIQSKCQNDEWRAEWDNFKIKRVDNYGDYKLIIYEFPEPKFAPEAKYAAVMLNTATLQADYYTLEMSDNDMWFYCGATEEEHFNYGEAEHTDLDHFIEWVLGKKKEVGVKTDWSTVSTPKNVN